MSVYQEMSSSIYEVSFFSPPQTSQGFRDSWLSPSSQPPDPSPAPPTVLQGEGVEPEVQKAILLAKVTQQESPLLCIHSFFTHSTPDGVCGPDLCRHWGKGIVAKTALPCPLER